MAEGMAEELQLLAQQTPAEVVEVVLTLLQIIILAQLAVQA